MGESEEIKQSENTTSEKLNKKEKMNLFDNIKGTVENAQGVILDAAKTTVDFTGKRLDDGALKILKFGVDGSIQKEAKKESRRRLEYTIDF